MSYYRYRTGAAGHERVRERDQRGSRIPAEAAYLRAARSARRSAVTDAVGLAPSLLPRPGAVALPSPSPSPPPRLRVSGVVWSDACVPGFGSGLARESVGGVGFEVGL